MATRFNRAVDIAVITSPGRSPAAGAEKRGPGVVVALGRARFPEAAHRIPRSVLGNRHGHLVLRGGGGRPNYDSVSVSLAEQLSSGVLVTREGEGHTGYNKGNACVDTAVEAYLVSGTVPQDGLTCTS